MGEAFDTPITRNFDATLTRAMRPDGTAATPKTQPSDTVPTAAAPRILVVDDERAIANLLVDLLNHEGMDAEACYSGARAIEMVEQQRYNLMILDIMMPGIDGFEVCSRVRSHTDMPIIFLSAKDEETDKVVGLMLGGDDYVVKPFKQRELIARIRARLRRAGSDTQRASHLLEAKGIEINLEAHTAALYGEALSLTPKEFGVLALLVSRAGSPVPTHDIYERVWGERFASSSANSVMVHIRHIRAKLAAIDASETFIETAWGVGYRIPRAAEGGHAEGRERPKGDA